MKAFTIYPKEQRSLITLIENLKKYGECNCDINTFAKIYNEWHLKTFPGCPVNTNSASFRGDWLVDFVNYIANYDIDRRN